MKTQYLTPILNVSDINESFQWFEKLGWTASFKWGDPLSFGGVINGEVEIFLCLNAQGGRGKGSNVTTFGADGNEEKDKGVWMSLWVDSVDDVYALCQQQDIEVTFIPTDMPWNVREMHMRHPDGHVFRVGHAINQS
ncbi:MAG: bleomycin resistance family protein [Gammaproteobacteria bacterium]|nr:bleomycin resistance family protein [Gammaproteobacteria bacterium]